MSARLAHWAAPLAPVRRRVALTFLLPLLAAVRAEGQPTGLRKGDEGGNLERRASSDEGTETETKYVAHVMPWFDRVTYRGVQGNHWCDADYGNSYYESVFGRYSSADPAVIRKQLLLMKTAGLDGVWIDLQIVEWLPSIRAIVKEATSLGMNFAVVVDNYAEPAIVDTVKDDMQRFMAMPNYYRVFGRPILPYYEHPWRWGSTKMPSWRASDGRRPFIIGTFMEHPDGKLPEGYDSLFFWHTPDIDWLDSYYKTPSLALKVGSVFHSWREAYADRKHVAPYMGYLESTLRLARQHRPYFAQLATWNDYTEGTMFEPAWLANVSSPSACADPRKSLWHDTEKTCAQIAGKAVFTAGGVIRPCTASAYEAAAANGNDTAVDMMCSGSGDEPCADVVDCSRPVGQLFGPPREGCPEGNRSAFAELVTLAGELAGLPAANASATFEAILHGWEPDLPAPDTAMSAAAAAAPAGGCFAFALAILLSARLPLSS